MLFFLLYTFRIFRIIILLFSFIFIFIKICVLFFIFPLDRRQLKNKRLNVKKEKKINNLSKQSSLF